MPISINYGKEERGLQRFAAFDVSLRENFLGRKHHGLRCNPRLFGPVGRNSETGTRAVNSPFLALPSPPRPVIVAASTPCPLLGLCFLLLCVKDITYEFAMWVHQETNKVL